MLRIFWGMTLIITMASCNQINNKNNGYRITEDTEFGDKLVIEREDTIFVRHLGDNNEKSVLQKGVILNYHTLSGKTERVYSWGGGQVVGSCIVRYGVDENFFIVEEKPLDEVFGEVKKTRDRLIRKKMPSTVLEMKTLLKHCNCSRFWIINIKKDDIYGPFDFGTFLQKRIELNVPIELTLIENENIK